MSFYPLLNDIMQWVLLVVLFLLVAKK